MNKRKKEKLKRHVDKAFKILGYVPKEFEDELYSTQCEFSRLMEKYNALTSRIRIVKLAQMVPLEIYKDSIYKKESDEHIKRSFSFEFAKKIENKIDIRFDENFRVYGGCVIGTAQVVYLEIDKLMLDWCLSYLAKDYDVFDKLKG